MRVDPGVLAGHLVVDATLHFPGARARTSLLDFPSARVAGVLPVRSEPYYLVKTEETLFDAHIRVGAAPMRFWLLPMSRLLYLLRRQPRSAPGLSPPYYAP